MKLFLIENEKWEYGEIDEALICAVDEEEAKRIYQEGIENIHGYTLKVTEVKLEKGILHTQISYRG